MDAALAARGLRRQVSAIVPAFSLVPALLERSDLIATLPAGVFGDVPVALALRPPPLPLPELALFVAWHPRSTANARHRWLRDSLLGRLAGRQGASHSGAKSE